MSVFLLVACNFRLQVGPKMAAAAPAIMPTFPGERQRKKPASRFNYPLFEKFVLKFPPPIASSVQHRGRISHGVFQELIGVQDEPFAPKSNSLIFLPAAYFSFSPVKTQASPSIVRKSQALLFPLEYERVCIGKGMASKAVAGQA